MKGTLKRLDTVHDKLSTAIRTTNRDLFFKRPSEDEWSIAEVVQHLCLAEQHVLKDLRKSLQTGPAKVGFLKKLVPMRDEVRALAVKLLHLLLDGGSLLWPVVLRRAVLALLLVLRMRRLGVIGARPARPPAAAVD